MKRQVLSTPLCVLLCGCAVVGPMVDRSLARAPNSACVDFTASHAPAATIGAQPVAIDCFTVAAPEAAAGKSELTGEGLLLRDALSIRLGPDPKCAGNYTNIVVSYAAASDASAMVTATNALGMALGSDRIKTDGSARVRTFVLREVGDALKHPINAEFSAVSGELLLKSVCAKGYWA